MINPQRKGAQAEREFAGLILDQLGVRMLRNLEQTRSGGHDLVVDPSDTGSAAAVLRLFAIECKRYRKISPAILCGFWCQASNQAEVADKTPLLAYRVDRQDWQVIVPIHCINPALPISALYDYTATLSLPGFCYWVREAA